MSRPKKTPENSDLMPWPEVGKHVGLTAKQAQKEGTRALEKLRDIFDEQGLGEEYLRSLAHSREQGQSSQEDALLGMLLSHG